MESDQGQFLELHCFWHVKRGMGNLDAAIRGNMVARFHQGGGSRPCGLAIIIPVRSSAGADMAMKSIIVSTTFGSHIDFFPIYERAHRDEVEGNSACLQLAFTKMGLAAVSRPPGGLSATPTLGLFPVSP